MGSYSKEESEKIIHENYIELRELFNYEVDDDILLGVAKRFFYEYDNMPIEEGITLLLSKFQNGDFNFERKWC